MFEETITNRSERGLVRGNSLHQAKAIINRPSTAPFTRCACPNGKALYVFITNEESLRLQSTKPCPAQYGVILDAGSSGTRLYVYKWKDPTRASKKASAEELHSLPKLKLEQSKKIHPGVSTFANDVASVGPDHLQELVNIALDEVPEDKIAETPIFLLATAGVRFLPKLEQTALLQGVCTWLQANTRFALPDCDTHIQVISGETEGLYGWLAANYLLGGFDHPQSEKQGSEQGHHHTYGFLDMGGASAQIAFAPNSTETEKHANDLKLVRMRHLDGTPAEYRVFTTTWLGFGANKARDRYVDSLRELYGSDTKELPDPCMPHGLRTTLNGGLLLDDDDTNDQSLAGTGKFDECLRKTYPLLGKDMPCEDNPCLVNGQHVPAIDFNVNRFVGVSEYWHTTHGVFGGKKEAYDLATYQQNVMEYCNSNWDDILDGLEKRKKSPERKAEDAREACFKASWLINMLYDGIGIPRIGLEDGPGFNETEGDSEHGEDTFKPVDKVDGVELSWTLGKMVLYAAGQVQPEGEALPVGFGSNVASGKPADFEEVGSVPLIPSVGGHDDDDDDDDLPRPNSRHLSGLVAVVILLLVAWYFLRKPETRQRIMSFTRRRRGSSSASRRPVRGFPGSSLANKLLGRSGQGYERVMEEGEAAEFELSGGDSDDNEHSDSSEGSRRGGRFGGSSTASKANGERFTSELGPQAALDRKGLAVRTESRDRLTTVGRRSRAGSPQRQKSSLMTPLENE